MIFDIRHAWAGGYWHSLRMEILNPYLILIFMSRKYKKLQDPHFFTLMIEMMRPKHPYTHKKMHGFYGGEENIVFVIMILQTKNEISEITV